MIDSRAERGNFKCASRGTRDRGREARVKKGSDDEKIECPDGKCFVAARPFPHTGRDKQEMLLRRNVVADFAAHLPRKRRRNRIVSRLMHFFHFALYITRLQLQGNERVAEMKVAGNGTEIVCVIDPSAASEGES